MNRVANAAADRDLSFFIDPRSFKIESLSRGVAVFLDIMELDSGSLTKLEKTDLERGAFGDAVVGGCFLLDLVAVVDGAFFAVEGIGASSELGTFFLWLDVSLFFFCPYLLLLPLPFFFLDVLAASLGVSLGVSFLDGAMVTVSN